MGCGLDRNDSVAGVDLVGESFVRARQPKPLSLVNPAVRAETIPTRAVDRESYVVTFTAR